MVNLGCHPSISKDINLSTEDSPETEQFLKMIKEIREEIESALKKTNETVTKFIRSYLHQFFDDSHGLKTSLKPLRRPFDQYQSRLEAINNGRDIKQINW